MLTLAGTVAAALLLPKVTVTPPLGAGPLRVTVPCELLPLPPVTVVGFKVNDDTTGPDELGVKGELITWSGFHCTIGFEPVEFDMPITSSTLSPAAGVCALPAIVKLFTPVVDISMFSPVALPMVA
jgi:hypothetical protein